MIIRFTDKAANEQDAIIEHLLTKNSSGARRVAESIQRALVRIELFPLSSQATDDPRIRRALATPYPYAILNEPTATEIIVHQIRHTARKPEVP